MFARIGYGLSLEEAFKKAVEELGESEIKRFSVLTYKMDCVYAESQLEGYSVYSEKKESKTKVETKKRSK